MAELNDADFAAAPEQAPAAEQADWGGDFAGAEPAAPPTAAAAAANGAAAADEDFFSSAGPADVPAPPQAPSPPLEADDPRIAWAAQNRAALQQREQAEAAKKVEALAKAKEYLDKEAKAREVQLSARKKANREAEAVSGVAEGAVPKGATPWERVISVCNFNAEGLSKDPFKEMSRYKAVLLAAKAANIPVSGK